MLQCYLPPGSGDFSAFTSAEAGTRFSDPGRTQNWVDLEEARTPSRRAPPPFDRYSPHLPTKGWPGWADLGDWLDGDKFRSWGVEPDTVTHPSTNWVRRRSTLLIWPTLMPTMSNRHHERRDVMVSNISLLLRVTRYESPRRLVWTAVFLYVLIAMQMHNAATC